jgi:hypothetical protein
MNTTHYTAILCAAMILLVSQPGCFFSGGAKTISKTTSAAGSGFMKVAQRNGQWVDGPPPQVGEVTKLTIYGAMEKEQGFALIYYGKGYTLSKPYSHNRYRIRAIREIDTGEEMGAKMYYYEVEFDIEPPTS